MTACDIFGLSMKPSHWPQASVTRYQRGRARVPTELQVPALPHKDPTGPGCVVVLFHLSKPDLWYCHVINAVATATMRPELGAGEALLISHSNGVLFHQLTYRHVRRPSISSLAAKTTLRSTVSMHAMLISLRDELQGDVATGLRRPALPCLSSQHWRRHLASIVLPGAGSVTLEIPCLSWTT